MDISTAMDAVRERAFAARATLTEVCARAGVHPAAFSRPVSVKVLGALERAMDAIENERDAA